MARRRVLVIARDYPPANSPGARRALKFTKYLPEFGWDSSVVTIRSRFHPSIDPVSLREVPSGTRVYPAFGFDTQSWLSINKRYPGFLAWPDRSVSWLFAAVAHAVRAVRRDRVDALLSTSPPVTAQWVGLLVKRITRRPWVVDLRDPWTPPPFDRVAARYQSVRLERRVVAAADRIVVTTNGVGQDLARRFGSAVAAKVRLITNGFDEADFSRLAAVNGPNEDFTIAHLGQLYTRWREPSAFLQAVRHCLDRGSLPDSLRIVFVRAGYFAECGALDHLVQRLRLEHCVRIVAPMPYDEALALMLRTPLLLLLGGADELYAIPSKAFEYLRSNRYILAIASDASDTRKLMRDHPGVFIASDDAGDIARQLANAYRAACACTGVDRPPQSLARYTRRETAGELARLLDALCDGE